MKQIIEEVIQAEAAAAARLKEAQEQAAALTAEAEAASLDRINQAKQQCQQQMQNIIEEATRAADQKRAEMLGQSEQQARDLLTKNPDRVEELVHMICEMILAAPGDNDADVQARQE